MTPLNVCPVVGIARTHLGAELELAAGSAGIGGGDRGLDDAFDLGCVEGIELPPTLALLLERICSAHAARPPHPRYPPQDRRTGQSRDRIGMAAGAAAGAAGDDDAGTAWR